MNLQYLFKRKRVTDIISYNIYGFFGVRLSIFPENQRESTPSLTSSENPPTFRTISREHRHYRAILSPSYDTNGDGNGVDATLSLHGQDSKSSGKKECIILWSCSTALYHLDMLLLFLRACTRACTWCGLQCHAGSFGNHGRRWCGRHFLGYGRECECFGVPSR